MGNSCLSYLLSADDPEPRLLHTAGGKGLPEAGCQEAAAGNGRDADANSFHCLSAHFTLTGYRGGGLFLFKTSVAIVTSSMTEYLF